MARRRVDFGHLLVSFILLCAASLPALAQDRGTIIAEICSGDFGAQQSALGQLAAAGMSEDSSDATWARRIVEAFEGRELRCGNGVALITTEDGAVQAASMEPSDVDAETLAPPSVNLRLREIGRAHV